MADTQKKKRFNALDYPPVSLVFIISGSISRSERSLEKSSNKAARNLLEDLREKGYKIFKDNTRIY